MRKLKHYQVPISFCIRGRTTVQLEAACKTDIQYALKAFEKNISVEEMRSLISNISTLDLEFDLGRIGDGTEVTGPQEVEETP